MKKSSNWCIGGNSFTYSVFWLDFKKLYTYLRDKYRVQKAFLFVGYSPCNEQLYTLIELGNFDKAVIVSGDGDFYFQKC